MTPRLFKLSIPKSSLAPRREVYTWLHAMMDGHDQLMPAARCPADALRVATSYVLRDWTSWKGEDGTVYRAIAASPTEQKGLVLDINVQVRRPDTVKYSELLCRLSCDENGRPGFTHGEAHGLQFYDLVQALNVERLLTLGQDHLFEQD